MNLLVVLEGKYENLGTTEGLEVFALCHDLFFVCSSKYMKIKDPEWVIIFCCDSPWFWQSNSVQYLSIAFLYHLKY